MIDIKILIRDIVPDYELDGTHEKIFIAYLKALYSKLKPIFTKYLTQEDVSESESPTESRKDLLISALGGNSIVLVSANSTKKKLKIIGVDPRKIIVSGGPLKIEDYIKINPDLTENALQGLNKKCKRLVNQLKSKDWKEKEFFFVYDMSNSTDMLIFDRLQELSVEIGTEVNIIKVNSLNDLDN